MTKICNKCEKELDIEKFEKNKGMKDGYGNDCKDCKNTRRRELHAEKNPIRARYWTNDEVDILIKHYPTMHNKDIHEKYLPNRTVAQIRDKATKNLKLRKDDDYSSGWTKEQTKYLKTNYENLEITIKEMSKFLDKSCDTITAKANKLDMVRVKEIVWTDEEIELIKKYYPNMKVTEFLEKYNINKTISQLNKVLREYGIKKSKEFRTKVGIENLKKMGDQSGENSPRWVGRIEIICEQCGKVMEKKESSIKNNKNVFCSIKCKGLWMSDNEHGENNPNYGNGDAWTPDMRKKCAERAVARLIKADKSNNQTKPQVIINDLLTNIGVEYTNEYDCKYYLLDNFLDDSNLGIEVHGNFYHCNPTMAIRNSRQVKIIGKDKAKHTYIKKYHGFEVLYIWEYDIINRLDVCEEIIKKYIENDGVLSNYHSFNYSLNLNELVVNDDIVEFHY